MALTNITLQPHYKCNSSYLEVAVLCPSTTLSYIGVLILYTCVILPWPSCTLLCIVKLYLPVVGILYSVAHNCVIFADTEVVFLCLCTTLPHREMGIQWHMEKRPSGMVIFQNK